MDPVLISLVSAATALVASIVGPFVTVSVAKKQINANVVSVNRQKWIDSLRDLIAELISLMVAVVVVKANRQGTWDRGFSAVRENPKLLQKLERIVLVQWKIRLLINPNEADHMELYQTIMSAFLRLQEEGAHEDEGKADFEHITALSQAILKREWQRVKAGT